MMIAADKIALLFLPAALFLSSCALVQRHGPSQTITVQTRLNGRALAGATCQLINERGRWTIRRTPGTATIERGTGNLVAVCQQGRQPPGFLTVKTGREPLPQGAPPGGNPPPAYANYPSTLTVGLGENRSVSVPAP